MDIIRFKKIRKILYQIAVVLSFLDFFACYLLPLIEFKFFQHIDGKMLTDRVLLEEKCLKNIIDYAGISFFTSFLEYKLGGKKVKIREFSCLDHTFPVHLFYQLYLKELPVI